MLENEKMSGAEWRASVSLASISGLRMFGLFIILPVFALYAENLPGGKDHLLIGVALGAYGLTQAILQIPFGWLSDRYGRKRVIYMGLVLFAAGSFIAAFAQDIYWIILGRTVQGAGAISAAAIALTADLVREEHRTKAMAVIGATIGITFALSMVLGPILANWIGVSGIFLLTGVMALLALWLVYAVVPNPAKVLQGHSGAQRPLRLAKVLHDRELLRLNYGVFCLHAVLMALFVVVPFALRDAGLSADKHWQIYLPIMLCAFILMIPPLLYAERKGRFKSAFVAAVALMLMAEFLLGGLLGSVSGIIFSLVVFFTAFNLLEASLPSLISKIAPAGAKGTAIGVYSSVQFLGTFIGAGIAGFLSQRYGASAVFVFGALLTVIWLVMAMTMNPPAAVRTKLYSLTALPRADADELTKKLANVSGVKEVAVRLDEGVAYLKVDIRGFDEQNVLRLISGGT